LGTGIAEIGYLFAVMVVLWLLAKPSRQARSSPAQFAPGLVCLRLSSNGRQVLVEVWDADARPPRAPALDANLLPLADAESGRGLFLVAALSERWSCYTVSAESGGKVVWAEVT
jgi:hypothetical protein